jgi:hypothetical protein
MQAFRASAPLPARRIRSGALIPQPCGYFRLPGKEEGLLNFRETIFNRIFRAGKLIFHPIRYRMELQAAERWHRTSGVKQIK